MLVFSAGIHKMLVKIANREDPDQTASSEAVCPVCLDLFGKQLANREDLDQTASSEVVWSGFVVFVLTLTSVWNFRTSTVPGFVAF